MSKKMTVLKSNAAIVNNIVGWTVPTFHQKSECYVSFTAFCPETGRMKLKKIMLGRIKDKRLQRLRAQQIIKSLTEKLLEGWNPWIEQMRPLEYTTFEDVVARYRQFLAKEVECHDMREDSVVSYLSYLRVFVRWVGETRHVTYVYQVDRRLCGEFLDYVFIELNNTLQTRNNYLAWLKTFCKWCLQRDYLSVNPVEGFTIVKKKNRQKKRRVIPACVMTDVARRLEAENRHFLLACHFIHYLLLRPKEMSYIRVRDICVREKTLKLHGEHTKNGNDAVVTVPDHVMRMMIDLGVFEQPGEFFLFSRGARPGAGHRDQRQFRQLWEKLVRRPLGLPESMKFYSFKDTGITEMLSANKNVLSVRDQARHSSIEITNMYTPEGRTEADPQLVGWRGTL